MKASVIDGQPLAASIQRSAASSQRSAASIQRSAVSSQRSAVSSQRSTASSQRSTASSQRSTASSQPPSVVRVALVGCCGPKAAAAAPARALYVSPLFRKALAWAERTHGEVRIVSAHLALVNPDARIEPYNRTVRDLGGKAERDAWGERVIAMLAAEFAGHTPELTLLLGRAYVEPLRAAAHRRGWPVAWPVEGLGLGERLAWFGVAS